MLITVIVLFQLSLLPMSVKPSENISCAMHCLPLYYQVQPMMTLVVTKVPVMHCASYTC